jgi:tetratricopeptide (TPR) repeat protein
MSRVRYSHLVSVSRGFRGRIIFAPCANVITRCVTKSLTRGALTCETCSAIFAGMAKAHKPSSGSSGRTKSVVHSKTNSLKRKPLTPQHPPQRGGVEMVDPRVQADEHYQRGVAMMNIGRWDDARESLDRARKAAPKADYIHYALAALDCLTGEADSAMKNLKVAIELRPENRYHARNDEDFAFLQEDPRFTEMLYPEKDGSAG